MANPYFQFKQFTVYHDRCAMKVTTDACLFGAWLVRQLNEKHIPVATALDLGTGTGLLSLMLAQHHTCQITAVEIDPAAAEQANENTDASPWKERITVVQTDARSFHPDKPVDLVLANPPFYENEWQSADEKKNAAHHSRDLLLDDVLDCIRRWMKPDGYFALLLPYKREKEIIQLLEKHRLSVVQQTKVRQSVTHGYFRLMLLGTHQVPAVLNEDEISIRDQAGAYTPAFVSLLKDYYLYV